MLGSAKGYLLKEKEGNTFYGYSGIICELLVKQVLTKYLLKLKVVVLYSQVQR